MKRKPSPWVDHHNIKALRTEYPEGSMFRALKETADEYPEYNAIDFYNNKIKFNALIKRIELTASYLYSMGVDKGDFISIISPNLPQALISVYAANRIGAVANMIHPALASNEIKAFVENVNSKAVVIYEPLFAKIKDISWSDNLNPKIITISTGDGLFDIPATENLTENSFNNNVLSWQKMCTVKTDISALPDDEGTSDDVAVILYSGGTTGIPKGVMITNMNMNAIALQERDVYEGNENCAGMKVLALMPIFHGFGLSSCMHSKLCNGVEVVLVPKFDFKESTDIIFEKKINFIFAVPAFFEAFSRSEKIEESDLSFIKMLVTAGDRAPEKMLRRVRTQLKNGGSKAVFAEAYGQTECLVGCCINPFFDMREGSIGIPCSDVELKIISLETNEELPDGQCGEICIKGPNVMKGYYNNEAATSKALQKHSDGQVWLHSGDMGYKKDGQFYYSQRICRMIITSGYNVFPAAIEEVIMTFKNVEQCCVVGIRDRIVGQKVCAVVVLKDKTLDQEQCRKEITEYCKNNMAEYSVPREIVFADKLPVSLMGKVDFKSLEKELNK